MPKINSGELMDKYRTWYHVLCKEKTDNAVVQALLQELENGCEGQSAATNFKPPQCVYQQ